LGRQHIDLLAGIGAGSAMAIYKLLQNSAFGPEQIKIMTEAYEVTLKALHLTNRSDPVTQIIATKIIDIARTSAIRHAWRVWR
jgi:hypothetical protein